MKPLGALGRTILLTSEKCRDGVKPWILASDAKGRHRVEMIAFYEFVFFFTHLTMRFAFTVMTETEDKHLWKHLLKYVGAVSVDATFESMPDDFRKRMITEFCENMHRAEVQYVKCAPTGDIFSGAKAEQERNLDALFMTLGDNVASAIGRKGDSGLKLKIATLAIEQFASLHLLRLVLDFKRDSMGLPDD